jgi:type III secretion protein U
MEMMETPTGAAQAVVLISNAPDTIVGVRYIEDETPAPLVVIRAKGADACRRLTSSVDVPTYIDSDLTKVLSKTPVGDYVVDEPTVMALSIHLQRALSES